MMYDEKENGTPSMFDVVLYCLTSFFGLTLIGIIIYSTVYKGILMPTFLNIATQWGLNSQVISGINFTSLMIGGCILLSFFGVILYFIFRILHKEGNEEYRRI